MSLYAQDTSDRSKAEIGGVHVSLRARLVGFYVLARAAIDYLRRPELVEDELLRALTLRQAARALRKGLP